MQVVLSASIIPGPLQLGSGRFQYISFSSI